VSERPVIISPRVASAFLRYLDARRLRVAFRDDAEIYDAAVALGLSAVAYETGMSGDGQEIAIGNGAADDSRMTVLQAARKARVSARTIVRAVHDGQLDADRFGPVWQISAPSLARYIAARESGGKRLKERTMA